MPLFHFAFAHNGHRYLEVFAVSAVEKLDLVEARMRNGGSGVV